MSTLARALLCTAALEIAGCSTVLSKGNNGWGAPYSGTECAAETMGGILESPLFLILLPFAIIDLPLSFVADTLVLPGDLWARKSERNVNCHFFHI